jgi:hypothetical protein
MQCVLLKLLKQVALLQWYLEILLLIVDATEEVALELIQQQIFLVHGTLETMISKLKIITVQMFKILVLQLVNGEQEFMDLHQVNGLIGIHISVFIILLLLL